jgi:hypothetical protein
VYERKGLSIKDSVLFGIGVERRVAIRGEDLLQRQKGTFRQNAPVPWLHTPNFYSVITYSAGGEKFGKPLVEPKRTGMYITLEYVMDELVKYDFIIIVVRCAKIEGDVVFIRAALKVSGQLLGLTFVEGKKWSIGALILESDNVGWNRRARPRGWQDLRKYVTKLLQTVERFDSLPLFTVRQQLEMSGLEPHPRVIRTMCKGEEGK